MRYIKKLKKISPRQWILILVFLIFFFFLRWNSFSTPFERDEGEYAYSAWIMRQGKMPYENSFLQKPPMIIYTYLVSQVLFGDNLWGPRLMAAIFTLFTSIFLFKIASRELGETGGWISIFIFTPIVVSPINSGLAANTEIFMLLPLVGLWYLFTHINKMSNIFTYLAIGVLSAVAILYKPICIYLIVFLLGNWPFRNKGLAKRGIILRLSLITLGGILSTGVIMVPFLVSDGGKSFWEQVIIFNGYYARHWGFSLKPLIINLSVMFKSFWIIYVSFFVFVIIRPKNWKFFLGILFFSLLGSYQTTIRHYLIIIMPILALITSSVVVAIVKHEKFRKYSLLVTVLIIFSILLPVSKQFGLTPQELSLWIYGTDNPFYESQKVAEKLAKYTDENDCVWVAGSEPQIYYYAKRLSCNKYVITYPFIVDTPLRSGYQKDAVNKFNDRIPIAIAYSNMVHSGLSNTESPPDFVNFLKVLIDENYHLKGGWSWRNGNGEWQESFEPGEIQNSSILLYKFQGKNKL